MKDLFSFQGRINRLAYWRVQLLLAIAGAAMMALGSVAIIGLGRIGGVVFALIPALLVIGFAAVLKRLHDRGKTLLWALFFTLGPSILITVAHVLRDQPSPILTLASLPFSLAGIGVGIWAGIEIGFLRGDPQPNRFGEPPLAAPAPVRVSA